MGADGHVQFLEIDKIPEKYKDFDLTKLGWYPKQLFGKSIIWQYWDTERDNTLWNDPRDAIHTYNRLQSQINILNEKGVDFYKAGNKYYEVIYNRKVIEEKLTKFTPEQLAESKQWDELSIILEGLAEDWEVWT